MLCFICCGPYVLAVMAAAAAVNASMMAAAAATHQQSTTVSEPINAVKLLADFDPHFGAYMKVVLG